MKSTLIPVHVNTEPTQKMATITAPKWMGEEARSLFNDYVEQLEPLQVLLPCDTHLLAVLCQMQIRYIRMEERLRNEAMTVPTDRGFDKKNPAVMIQKQALDIWLQIAGLYGLTPTAREKITHIKPNGRQHKPTGKTIPFR